MTKPILLFVDLFCGAGGVTTGIEHAQVFDKKIAQVIACVNHDKNAIASHLENHPHCIHFTEDIRTLNLDKLSIIVKSFRDNYPEAKVCLWASLECTNFSKAKGGLPRKADSRTLAEHLLRYIDAEPYDYIFIENVEEFMSWGPLDINGKPVSKDRGRDYVKWVKSIRAKQYDFEHRILNAADFGAHTSRKRFFGVFAKVGLDIKFPDPTHAKKPDPMFGLKKWKPVKEVLDFSDEGNSIFTRKKALSERTLQRIYSGLIKYVANGDKSFLLKYNSINQKTGVHVPPSINDPSPVISCQGRLGLVNIKFLSYYYGNGYESSVEQPCGSLRTKDTCQLVQPEFLINQQGRSNVEAPAGSVMPVPKMNLIDAWVLSPHFYNQGTSIDDPMPTIMANRKHHCLMFPQWGENCSHSIDSPSPVLPARMDKMCPYLIQAEGTNQLIAIVVFDDDSENTKKIKAFMAYYGIIDIKMRMLRIKELKKITGFDENYVLIGTQQEQKKYIGNAVPVKMAKAIIESTAEIFLLEKQKAA